jgi:ligand-binding sensor domain-containing protein
MRVKTVVFSSVLLMSLLSPGGACARPAGGLGNLDVYALMFDASGSLYAGTDGGVFRTQAGQGWSPVNTGLTNLHVRSLAKDGAGNIYAGTGAGVFKLSSGGAGWVSINTGPTMPTVSVRALLIDSAGNLYAGTSGGGVQKLPSPAPPGTWFPFSGGLNSQTFTTAVVNDFAVDGAGNIYAATDIGVAKLANKSATWVYSYPLVSKPSFLSLAIDSSGTLYAGSEWGGMLKTQTGSTSALTNWSFTTWTTVNAGLNNLYVGTLAFDTSGNLYAGTNFGVFKMASGSDTWSAVSAGLPGLKVRTLLLDSSDTVFAGAVGDGILRIPPTKWSTFN